MTLLERWCAPVAVAVAVVCATSFALAQPKPPGGPAGFGSPELSDETELARAVALYEAAKYGECVQELDTLIGGAKRKIESPEVLERARVYFAACLIATGQVAKADEQLRAAILANPVMTAPDSLVFPPPVVDRFYRIQKELRVEIEKAQAEELAKRRAAAAEAARRAAAEKRRVERLEEMAGQEYVVEKNNRWLAAVPFGAGQFQNRDPALGWVLLTSEALLAGTALTAMVIELGLHARADDDPPPDPEDLNNKLSTAHQVLVFSSWSFIGVAALGVTQAQLAFVPEFREVRRKPLPKDLRQLSDPQARRIQLVPIAAPAPGGGTLGVVGRF